MWNLSASSWQLKRGTAPKTRTKQETTKQQTPTTCWHHGSEHEEEHQKQQENKKQLKQQNNKPVGIMAVNMKKSIKNNNKTKNN